MGSSHRSIASFLGVSVSLKQTSRWIRRFQILAFGVIVFPVLWDPRAYLETKIDPNLNPGNFFRTIAALNPLRHLELTVFGLVAWILLALTLATLSLRRSFKALCILSWVMWLCLVDLHGSIHDVSIGFMGWMMAVMAWMHPDDRDYGKKQKAMAPVALWVFGLTYTASGLTKWIYGPSWGSGHAFRFILENDLFVRPLFSGKIPDEWHAVFQVLTWGALGVEVLALPGVLWVRTRKATWVALTALQLGLAAIFDFGSLNFVLLVFHLWVADLQNWAKAR
ncbi:MAG: hypothetical protein JNL01_04195 [Bdellovibrionales bacterium]|nr:hypothetical protein [Bdellovibrionales bacterium]